MALTALAVVVLALFACAVNSIDVCAMTDTEPACLSYGTRCAWCKSSCMPSDNVWNDADGEKLCSWNRSAVEEMQKLSARQRCISRCRGTAVTVSFTAYYFAAVGTAFALALFYLKTRDVTTKYRVTCGGAVLVMLFLYKMFEAPFSAGATCDAECA